MAANETTLTPEMIEAGLAELRRQIGTNVFEGLVLNVADIYRAMRPLEPAHPGYQLPQVY